MRHLSTMMRLAAGALLGGTLLLAEPAPAEAHLANFGSWEITRGYLQEIFPDATDFLRRRDSYTDAEVAQIEAELGFELYPEDRNPEFYIAVDESSGKRKFLGVALFIDPRVESRLLEGNVVRIEVGIGVDARGRVKRVRLFDYRGARALTRAEFLDQLVGLSLNDSFEVGPGEAIKPVEEEPIESQLVANAAREALYLMKVSLGQGG
ncbi:hypothetical protein FRC98_06270 [Lujinxingia vulgaris]|uniref:FMN-binding protein n=1 Tax=Lujinxingia vulgaris TaxID=2600176 RepID=A0A5C6XMA9_9DELT|nr:hypothetical protein [Lujinxingia vulgaris]TXD38484.1 hypothetical protein FRC98_06270 [Lujinxingia vulgaris]